MVVELSHSDSVSVMTMSEKNLLLDSWDFLSICFPAVISGVGSSVVILL